MREKRGGKGPDEFSSTLESTLRRADMSRQDASVGTNQRATRVNALASAEPLRRIPLISSGELPPALARARLLALAAIRSTKRRIGLDVVETAPLGLRTRKPRPGPPRVRCFVSRARTGPMPGRLVAPHSNLRHFASTLSFL